MRFSKGSFLGRAWPGFGIVEYVNFPKQPKFKEWFCTFWVSFDSDPRVEAPLLRLGLITEVRNIGTPISLYDGPSSRFPTRYLQDSKP